MFKRSQIHMEPEGTTATPVAPAPTPTAPAPAPAAAAPAPVPAPAPTPAPAPVEYKIKLPENSYMKPADVEKLTAFAKERKFTPEQAQAFVDWGHEQRAEFQSSAMSQLEEQGKSWLAEVKADPQIGGAKWGETEANVRRAFELGDPDGSFRKELEAAHLSYNPGFVRFLSALGAARKEDSLAAPWASAPPVAKDGRPTLERLADSFRKK